MSGKEVSIQAAEKRHPEFEKIHRDFLAHYSNDPSTGERRYSAWIKALNLDESKSYREQAVCSSELRASFRWAKFLLKFIKEDADAKYYKVEALFPIESLNGDVFTGDELLQAARTLTGKPSNLNHNWQKMLPEIEIIAAQYEDESVECLVRIVKTSIVIEMIDRGDIVNVSIEGNWTHGESKGLVLSGLGWLTKDVLPGIPLTRIIPVERIAESAFLDTAEKLEKANSTIEDLKKQLNPESLLKNPPKLMAISEVADMVKSVLPSKMVQRSWSFGPQRLCQELRRVVLQLEQKAGGS